MSIKGSCHCGRTKFEVTGAPETVTRCLCSCCAKHGALWAYYKVGQFKLLTPCEDAATYTWRTKTVKHHFCATCGCTTFSETPDWSTGEPDTANPMIAVNAHVLDDFDLDAVPVTVLDGKNLW